MGWRKGELIMTSEPFVHVLSSKFREQRCSFCLSSKNSVKKCTACCVLYYCGRDCQKQDWRIHKQECKCLQRVAPNVPPDCALVMLRLIIRYLAGEHTKTMETDPGLRTFSQFMSHAEEIKKDVNRYQLLSRVDLILSQLAGDELRLPDMSQILDIFGKLLINTFSICNQEMQDIASGVYLSPSLLDHRCVANAVVTFRGKTLLVHAVEDIPDGTLSTIGQTVYISYVEQLAPSFERQKELQQQYYFTCKCPRCQSKHLDERMTGLSSAVSDLKTKGGPCWESSFKAAVESCQKTVETVEHMKKTNDHGDLLSMCRDCVAKVKDTLSPRNIYMVRLLDQAMDAAVNHQQWEEALGYGLQTLDTYRAVLPAYSPVLALQLMRVGKLQLWLNQLSQGRETVTQALAMIQVTHGRDSELCGTIQALLRCVGDV